MVDRLDYWIWFARRPLWVLGLIAAVVGVAGWISGWRYGHGLTTVALFVMVIGSSDYKFTIPYSQGLVSVYYSRKYLADGDDEEALRLATKAVRRFGLLATYRPEHTWLHAAALDHQWGLLNSSGRHEEALAAAEAAVAAWRTAVAYDAKWSRSLADALHRVVVSRTTLDTTDGLLEPTLEAIDLHREHIAYGERQLAANLDNLGIIMRRLDQWSEALAGAEELVAVRRRMLARSPSDQELALGLAKALYDLGRTLGGTDRVDDAGWALREAIELYQGETSDIGSANRCRHAARGLEAMELLDDALDGYRTALAIRRLAGARDDKLADDLTATATLLLRLDRHDEALPMSLEAVDVGRHLGQPARLAGALHLLGTVYEQTGELDPALTAGEEALAIIEQLATDDHDHDQLHHLMQSLDDHASLLRRIGRNDEAREAETKAAALRRAHDRPDEPGHDPVIDNREP